MPPRTFTNPAPKTESAREAAKNFFCELCQKGYQRHNEYEAHMSSFMHCTNVRLKDMKGMSKDPLAAEKARRAERARDKEAGLVKLDMSSGSASASGASSTAKPSGFKKGGFKSAFGGGASSSITTTTPADKGSAPQQTKGGFKKVFGGGGEGAGSAAQVGERDGRAASASASASASAPASAGAAGAHGEGDDDYETDSDEDLGYEKYDPLRPTGCRDPGCNCRHDVIAQTIFPV